MPQALAAQPASRRPTHARTPLTLCLRPVQPLTATQLRRQWASAVRTFAAGERPSPAVAAASELIKSMLLIGVEKGTLGGWTRRAGTGRGAGGGCFEMGVD